MLRMPFKCVSVLTPIFVSDPVGHYVDIVFLVDGSQNLARQGFQQIRSLLIKMVNRLDIGIDRYRIGLAQYNGQVHTEFLLNRFQRKDALLSHLKKKYQYKGGSPLKTGRALDYIHKTFFTASAGSRKHEGIPQIAIVITSMRSKDDVTKGANALKNDRIKILSIGVKNSDLQELQTMAFLPNYVFQTKSVNNLPLLARNITAMVHTVSQPNIILDEPRVCQSASVADIVFVVDESSSIGEINFQLIRDFLRNLISVLDVGPEKVQIGLLQYSSITRPEFYLNTFQNKPDILRSVQNMLYRGGATYTGEALKHLKQHYFSPSSGSRLNQGVPQIAVVVTDGKSQDDVSEAASALRHAGVSVFAFGIKDAVESELRKIASYPAESHVELLQDFDLLKKIENRIEKKICTEVLQQVSMVPKQTEQLHQGCVETEEANIFFLVDGSSSIRPESFQDLKRFLVNIVNIFSIGADQVRVAVVQYADNARMEFESTQYTHKTEVERAIKQIVQIKGGTNTGRALTYMKSFVIDAERSRKTRGRSFLITVTDGKSQDDVINPAVELRQQGVTVYAVGVGDASENELQLIAGADERVFYTDNFDALAHIENSIVRDICSKEACSKLDLADIIFLIDGSGSINAKDFLKMKQLIGVLVNKTNLGVDKVQIDWCGAQVADIVFVIDGSESLSAVQFNHMKDFMVGLVNGSDVAADKVQFGAVLYGDNPQTVFQLDQFTNKNGIQNAINGMNPVGGSTHTAKALSYAKGLLDPVEGGRKQFGVPQFLLLFTGGKMEDKQQLKSAAEVIRNSDINIYAIGVENKNKNQLLQIAGFQDNPFYALEFETLGPLMKAMFQKFCDDSKPDCEVHEADVVFLIDGSGSTSASDFKRKKDILKSVVKMFNTGPTKFQFAVVEYSTTPVTIFQLNGTSGQHDLLDRIEKIQQLSQGTMTGKALQFVMDLFQPTTGSRKLQGVPQHLLVITDGKSQDSVVVPANSLRKENINVFAIGVGKANENELLQISGAPERKIYVEKFAELDQIKSRIVHNLCVPPAEAFFPPEMADAADVVFLVEGTQDIQEFKQIQNFMMGITAELNIGLHKNRIGFAQFGRDIKTEFLLKQYANKKDVWNYIKMCQSATVADIVYLVDESSSIGETNFELIRNFLVNVINAMDIGPDKVQIGLIQYSTITTPEFYLNTFQQKREVLDHIRSVPYRKGGTHTGEAINYMVQTYFTESRGSRINQGIPQVAVIITDGKSADDVKVPASALRALGVKVFAFGIKEAVESELQSIASYPASNYVSHIEDFDLLRNVEDQMRKKICNDIVNTLLIEPHQDHIIEQDCGPKSDIIFLIDGSTSIKPDDFQKMKTFMTTFLNKSDVGPNKVQIGVIQFSTDPKLMFQLNKYTSKTDLHSVIDKMPQQFGNTYTGEALTFTADYFDEAKGGRTGIPQYLIVITDGEAHDEVFQPAKAIRDKGVTVFALGVFTAKYSQLLKIGGSHDRAHYVESFDGLAKMEHKISWDMCHSPSDCKWTEKADILFVIDGSGSITSHQFESMRTFMLSLVNRTNVAKNKVRIGALIFGDKPETKFELDVLQTRDDVRKQIMNWTSVGGSTYTVEALQLAKTLLGKTHGGRKEAGVPQFLILITDGQATEKKGLNSTAAAIRDSNVQILAVGVQNAVEEELRMIAGSDDKWFYVHNFTHLEYLSKNISNLICSNTEPDCEVHEADIVFLIDGSGSIAPNDFESIKKFLEYIIKTLRIGPTKFQFALAQYSSTQATEFYLNYTSAQTALFEKIKNIAQLKAGTNTGLALKFVSGFFEQSAGSRKLKGVPQFLLVITDGQSQDSVVVPASNLRKENINVIAIGVGEANADELLQISGAPDRKFHLSGYKELDKIKRRITRELCTKSAQGVHALITVALEGAYKVNQIPQIEFGTGFSYKEQLSIGMEAIGDALLKKIKSVAEKQCCNVNCVCTAEPGRHGYPGNYGMEGSRGLPGLSGHPGIDGEEWNANIFCYPTPDFTSANIQYYCCTRVVMEAMLLMESMESRAHLVSVRTEQVKLATKEPQGYRDKVEELGSKVAKEIQESVDHREKLESLDRKVRKVGVDPEGSRVRMEFLVKTEYMVILEQKDILENLGNLVNMAKKGPKEQEDRGVMLDFLVSRGFEVILDILEAVTVNLYRTFGRIAVRRGVCPAYPTELVFALDRSSDVTPVLFERMKGIVINLLQDMNIAESNCPSGARIAILTYDNEVRSFIRFSDFKRKTLLMKEIEGLRHERSTSKRNIGIGMQFVARNTFKRARNGILVRKIAVFITNGGSQDTKAVSDAVSHFGALAITPVIISFKDIPDIERVFKTVVVLPRQQRTSQELLRRVQLCTLCFANLDIAFVVDDLQRMETAQSETVQHFLYSMVNEFVNSPEPKASDLHPRVALVQYRPDSTPRYGKDPFNLEFGVLDYTAKTLKKRHIQDSFSQLEGSSGIGNTIEWSLKNFFSNLTNQQTYKVIFTIFSGETSINESKLLEISQEAKCKGFTMLALALGEVTNVTVLEEFVSFPFDQHLLHLDRALESEMEYAQRFAVAFLKNLAIGINNYPPAALQRECEGLKSQGTVKTRTSADSDRANIMQNMEESKDSIHVISHIEWMLKLLRNTIVHERGKAEHDRQLSALRTRLTQQNLMLNNGKWTFVVSVIDFLEYSDNS
ncbi:hypothetical protein scyTo_0001701 [Scyliorhinus torazame]|uniref:VWFA domain-containing protein n=1 Tax=Scyliorhinus torazame TaxID=75743 RepID=A0A401PF96_SCYTO|nr:hypothetical protein [Scyliorhinus torazame]